MVNYINNISVEDYNFLRKSAGWAVIETRQSQAGINNSAYLVAAMDDGKAIGTARAITDGGYVAYIADVIVLPEYQGKGIGKRMLQMIMDYLAQSIHEGQSMFINLMAANGKDGFYSKLGFNKGPNDYMGYGMTQWIRK